MTGSSAPDAARPAPASPPSWPLASLRRRAAALLYEGVVLFGVIMLAALLYGLASGQRHALEGRLGLQLVLFAVLGLYFAYFWSNGGQTVAMRAWRVRLLTRERAPVGWGRAAARYFAAWLWLAPPLLMAYALQWHDGLRLGLVLAAWGVAYGASAWFNPERQFWHDLLCGTRLLHEPASPPRGHNARP